MAKLWRLKGYDTFARHFYDLKGEYNTEQEARVAAMKQWEELEKHQPSAQSGGQPPHGLQDQVFIARPDGSSYLCPRVFKIFVKAKPGAREAGVERLDATHFNVAVKEPPIQGKANAAILRALVEYFQVGAGCVRIVSGHTSRQKIVEIKN